MPRANGLFLLAGHSVADVAAPQVANLVRLSWENGADCANVSAGRSQAAYTSDRGRGDDGSSRLTLQENRSRGCPRAPRPFWQCALSLSLQHAPRKKKPFTSNNRPCRLSRPTPASSSKYFGRANGALTPRPALFLSAACAEPVKFDAGPGLGHHRSLHLEREQTC